ncbi:MAG: NYN domain-containing protein [Gammaproteobacteria bacterium]|nr:NYN domain-containing protein [Gammaproteobacteria bacterium]
MNEPKSEDISISQTVAILIDGNNIERSIHDQTKDVNTMLNFDKLIPKLLGNRGLNRLIYFREGKQISQKLKDRLHEYFHGSVRPCHKSADIPLSINAMQLASKVDTIVIMSGDSDYIELVRHLKSEGVRVEIASVDATTAHIIKEECDHHYRINDEDWFTYAPKQANQNNKQNKRRSNKKAQNNQNDKQAATATIDESKSTKANAKNTEKKSAKSNEERQPSSNESDILTTVKETSSRKYEPDYPQSQYIEPTQ